MTCKDFHILLETCQTRKAGRLGIFLLEMPCGW